MTPRNDSLQQGGILGSVAKFWTHSYAPDYVGFAGLLTAYLLIQFLVEPFHRMFYINNLNISFPHAEVERVPVWLNFVYALFVPLGFLLLYNSFARASFHKHHSTILGLAIALILSSFLTDIVKNTVGRPRPDLIARCKPVAGTKPNVLVTIDVCTETNHHTLHDGWRIFRDRKDLGRSLICLAPLVGAAMIAISRCQDYRHDVYDVCVGSALGFTVGFFSYRRYWPRLSSRECDEPYPAPGTEVKDGEGWRRIRDEEEGGLIIGRNTGYEMVNLIGTPG
ncbi:acid phosphatase/Vanadium-dependent haloperoxidase [Daldinia decipiens]|uniref:acid phosphatase/Vanadium-dependent haloperoxidase n=1 Tax=Daldinia decipiens TaxID=326647 RepID=UPI0020C593F2|nr:acid phosphatase/Vanadium-dependent haloperoxidase [Daldinia decipiens]KAI1655984.1 acid phosphatase/Vanadium-dependent haloperoxidase [Daldinia decipiens]